MMQKSFRKFWCLIASIILLTLSAFGRSEVELRLVVWDGNEALDILRKVVGEFEKAHPGIKVRLENADYRYFFQKLLAQVAANTAPDVTMLDPQNFQKYARRDALLKLDDLVTTTDGFKLDDYYPEIVKVFRYKEGLYVIPRDIAPIGLIYYNKRMFKEAGLDLPDGSWTWDFAPRPELGSKCFTNVIEKLTVRNKSGKVDRWGFAPSWTGAFTDTLVFSSGTNFVNDPAAFKELNFTDPRIVKAFDFVTELSNKKRWMPSQTELTSVVQSTAVDLFIKQKVAMYQCGIWDVPKIRDSLKPGSKEFFDWDITLAPGHIDSASGKVNRGAPTGGSGYAIMKSTPHPKESWLLVQWMAGPRGMKAMAAAGIAQPAIQKLAQGPDWIPNESTPLEQKYPASRIVTDLAVKDVVFPPTAEYWAEVSGLVWAKTEPIYAGTQPAKEALEEGNRIGTDRLNSILKEESLSKFDWRIGTVVGIGFLAALIGWVYWPERKKTRSAFQRAENRMSLWFLSPWIIGTLVFTVGPMVLSFLMSFSEWDIIQPAKWRALGNYQEAFGQDARFWGTVKVTTIYTLFSVPLGVVMALLLALLLNTKVRGMALYRTMFYLPALASTVASALIWRKVFQPEGGLLNTLLFGSDAAGTLPNWLGDEKLALPSLIIMSLWSVGGGMVVLLAGLQGIPDFYYEAATLDGANLWHKFKVVTIPMLSPALFFTLITGVIGSFQAFTQAFVMTQGGPNDSTRFYMLHLYEQAFGNLRMGYASALAWILFGVVFVVTKMQLKLNKHVYYEGAS